MSLRFVCTSLCALALSFTAPPAGADPYRILGWYHVITNDSIGQGRDRWQSSTVEGSLFLGRPGTDPVAARPGEIIELRLGHRIITPENLSDPQPGDRLFVGAFTLSALTHGRLGPWETTLGASLTATGPQTGTFQFQTWLHERLGFPLPAPEGFEVGDGFHPSVTAEIGRSFSGPVTLRPFVEAQAGVETLLRAGVDLTWGDLGRDDVMTREAVTGQRLPGLMGPDISGWSFLAGADVAHVESSAYLPRSRGYDPEPRTRLRAGAHWQTDRFSAFYGLTWLSPEFERQREGQLVGAVQLRVAF